jgi:uncharacterized tellurite resistance protein B-like protein
LIAGGFFFTYLEEFEMLMETTRKNRGKALEEAFFFRMDQELIGLLGKKLQRDEKVQAFADATGIRDRKRIERLINAGFEVPTLTAFIWVPLVFVAWADGNVDELERKAFVDVLTSKGVSEQTASMMIAHQWFHDSPSDELWNTWEEFAVSAFESLNSTSRNELIDEIVGLCYVVAHASGGFLGVGKVSQMETEVIDRVTESLSRADTSGGSR